MLFLEYIFAIFCSVAHGILFTWNDLSVYIAFFFFNIAFCICLCSTTETQTANSNII